MSAWHEDTCRCRKGAVWPWCKRHGRLALEWVGYGFIAYLFVCSLMWAVRFP